MKTRKQILSGVIVASLAIVMIVGVYHVINGNASQPVASNSVKVSNGMYTVTNEKNKTARLDKVSSKNKTTLTIPATVKIGKKTYKVVAIKANALKNNKKIKNLVIGKNIKTIGKQAFYGCKNLKKITIKTTKLTAKSVRKQAFAKLNSKATIIVPTGKFGEYQWLLKARGVTGKNQVIKTNEPDTETASKKPTVIPEPEVRFAIGELSNKNRHDFWADTKTDETFSVDDNIKFSLSIKMPQEIYGSWSTKKKQVKMYDKCNPCKKLFDIDTNNLAVHQAQTGHGGSNIVTDPRLPNVEMWYWTPDYTPCGVVYHIMLPQGIGYYEGSAELYDVSRLGFLEPVSNDKYTVVANGNDIAITVKDLKLESNNGAVIHPFVATIKAKVDESAAVVNQVNADITYNYSKGDKTIVLNPVTVRKK